MADWYEGLVNYLHEHEIKIVKDVIVPCCSPDKIVALIGLIYLAKTFVSSYKLSRVNFIFQLTQAHREIWSNIASQDLLNISNRDANPNDATLKEEKHSIFIILHIKVSYEANRSRISILPKEELKDIGQFMNKPIPNLAWNKIKQYHNKDFVRFIENAKYLADPVLNPRPQRFFLIRQTTNIVCLITISFYNWCIQIAGRFIRKISRLF